MSYNHRKIEPKRQKIWAKTDQGKAKDFCRQPKMYLLIEFPYPSGDGLHVGHIRSYTAFDVLVRKKRMEGFNVLYPIGWDAFGLPTENYALKTGIHPAKVTQQNIKKFRQQLKSLGLSFDWSREVNTTDPKYYKWTQWIFLKLFEHGLAYQAKMPINWCPSCKIGLANEEVVDGRCERCKTETERREIKQWVLKITKYADRLIEDLAIVDFLPKIKAQQINWIGRSSGTNIRFQIADISVNQRKNPRESALNPRESALSPRESAFIEVFTTRVDTIFGVTAIILAPEHPLIENLKLKIENWEEVKKYLEQAKRKSDLERTDLSKVKTGVELKGIKAINPINSCEIPVWVGDYVIATYGGGAVIMVAAHDERDFAFAQKYNLPIVEVVKSTGRDIERGSHQELLEAFCSDGVLINSDQFNGLTSEEAREKITEWLIKHQAGERQVNYKLRDWIFSRQHYWGEPIPLVYCKKCAAWINPENISVNPRKYPRESALSQRQSAFSEGELLNPGWVPVPEEDLPLELPKIDKYEPSGTGESPLAKITSWVNTKCPRCGGPAKRETDTMPNWAGSNWYFIRYTDPHNDKALADPKKIKYWLPVDWYNGGMEHTTLHLLYSRFIYKFLYDIGVVPQSEPYKKRTSHGMVLAEDGQKMSKSFNNVINPDEIVKKYGADALRLYEMFMGPFDEAISWSTQSLVGCYRFLNRIWDLQSKIKNQKSKVKNTIQNLKLKRLLHKTIKKVSEDVENLKFNTAISSLMILVNEMEKCKFVPVDIFRQFLIILAPFAPHLAEELWHGLENKKSIFKERWPVYDTNLIKDEKIELIVQINGKLRDKIIVKSDIKEIEAKELVMKSEKIKRFLADQSIKRVIFVPGRLINLVL